MASEQPHAGTGGNEGIVLEIQRMSTEDGPGLRTTAFMKGCPLHCAWCHNPESISPAPQVVWSRTRCIGCRSCANACPRACVSFGPDGVDIKRDSCVGCGACAEACPASALELLGRRWEPGALFRELLKDRAYFEKSGGGVTIGGGEATLQARFVAELLRLLKEAGIHTAIDTCGLAGSESLEMILPHADLVLYDVKEMDPVRHRELTGSPNAGILANLVRVSRLVRERGRPRELWIRTPLIPGATARPDNILEIGGFIADNLGDSVSRWELLAFNNLCIEKYRRLGRKWAYAETRLLSAAAMDRYADAARRSGVRAGIVSWSGMTAREEESPPRTD